MDEKIYIFKVNMKQQRPAIHRTLELKGSTSLYNFAEVIVNAFGFQFDHCFGFHDNLNDAYGNSREVYTLFADLEEGAEDPREESVKENFVYKVFAPKKKMLFHFDYGDDWMFLVNCLDVVEPDAGKVYPLVSKVTGKAPEQYPDCG